MMHCILFYKYHPLTDDRTLLETYRAATEALCSSLNLTGRILIGLSNDGEGINGTLSGAKQDLDAYVACMLGRDCILGKDDNEDDQHSLQRRDAIKTFRHESKEFFNRLNKPELLLNSANDFKWSSHSTDVAPSDNNIDLFPDLNIKIVNEIISTGGVLSNIPTTETSVGYLTPREWHEEIKSLVEKKKEAKTNKSADESDDVETVLIDVRNHKECQIGSFAPGIAIDPHTKSFAQFPKWVKDNAGNEAAPLEKSVDAAAAPSSTSLSNKRILLYCTGGIRCEKASAYVRQMVPQNKGIFHLKGGIHKYLEEFGGSEEGSQFVGKNFVFDRRGALNADDHGQDSANTNVKTSTIVGKCIYCSKPHDIFQAEHVCTVCREPVLVCDKCKSDLEEKQKCSGAEFHCEDHFHLASCYFTNLAGFSLEELRKQVEELNDHLAPLLEMKRKGKQRRKSLRKQINKVEAFIKSVLEKGPVNTSITFCRHCGSESCDQKCWGFHGGNKCLLNKKQSISGATKVDCVNATKSNKRTRTPSNQRPSKQLKREKDLSEIEALKLWQAPSQHRNDVTGLRCPPPVIRTLSTTVKGRWCGQTFRQTLTAEFGLEPDRLEQLMNAGLIRINGAKKSLDTTLLNGDNISRIVHWHEPPIMTPAKISLTKHPVRQMFEDSSSSAESIIYCINKPSTIPVYPAGPFYANSLLSMVEAQEGLPPKSLHPCHRLDRCTSGVLLCTNTSEAASLVQRHLQCKDTRKLYVARVKGKFPTSSDILNNVPDFASLRCDDGTIEVSAPISTQLDSSSSDEMLKRFVCRDGKPSVSRFRKLHYDPNSDLSTVLCRPLSGRGHQLRVHLALLGNPIHNDIEYGGSLCDGRKKEHMALSIDALLGASAENAPCLREESVSLEEADAAVKLCSCCSGGVEGVTSSFKVCQLLGGLQAIDLHAAKYFIGTDSKSKATFVTDLPEWANAVSNEGLEFI